MKAYFRDPETGVLLDKDVNRQAALPVCYGVCRFLAVRLSVNLQGET